MTEKFSRRVPLGGVIATLMTVASLNLNLFQDGR